MPWVINTANRIYQWMPSAGTWIERTIPGWKPYDIGSGNWWAWDTVLFYCEYEYQNGSKLEYIFKYNIKTGVMGYINDAVPYSDSPAPVPTEPRIDCIGEYGIGTPVIINSDGQVWKYVKLQYPNWEWANLNKTAKDIACGDFEIYIIGTDNKIYKYLSGSGSSTLWEEFTNPPLVPVQISVDAGGTFPGWVASPWIITKYYNFNVIFKYNWNTKNWDYVSVQSATDIAAGP